MYNKYYGFTESPFNLTPNSRFFFASDKHKEALDSMVYAIDKRKGFIVITGEIGAGKTTVCRTVLNKLEPGTQVALITNTHLSTRDLLMTILDDLEIDYKPGPKSKLLGKLNDYLIEQLSLNNNVVLLIDEAQNLTPSVLEEIRMLSNLETETEKLIQIILMGQPELKEKLGLSRLEQLRQRVAIFYHLEPLELEESKAYIRHRCNVAGGQDRVYFTDDALDEIFNFTQGVPRLINQICDNALLTGYVEELNVISAATIAEVIGESPLSLIAKERKAVAKKNERPGKDHEGARSVPQRPAFLSETLPDAGKPQGGRSIGETEKNLDTPDRREARAHAPQHTQDTQDTPQPDHTDIKDTAGAVDITGKVRTSAEEEEEADRTDPSAVKPADQSSEPSPEPEKKTSGTGYFRIHYANSDRPVGQDAYERVH